MSRAKRVVAVLAIVVAALAVAGAAYLLFGDLQGPNADGPFRIDAAHCNDGAPYMLLWNRANSELGNPPDFMVESVRMEFKVGAPGWSALRVLSLEMVLLAEGKAYLASGHVGIHDCELEDFKIEEGIRKAAELQPFNTDPACYDLEPPVDRTGLISRNEAQGSMGWLAGGPAPGRASGVEIAGVTASCLTTFGAYAQRFYRPGDWSNTPPDTPVWVVEVKGVSQYLGSDSEPWQYAMNVLHAELGSSMEGARYLEPRLAPTVRDGS